MIDAIGEVTLGSKSAINAARAAYKELTAAQQELVGNYGVLLDAIARYEELTGGEGVIHIEASAAAAAKGEQNPKALHKLNQNPRAQTSTGIFLRGENIYFLPNLSQAPR